MKKSKVIAIYKIICAANNRIYIGSSINVYKRWHNHRYELNNKKHHAPYLQHAWSKYGEDSFSFEIIEKLETNEFIIDREQFWMDYYNSYNPKYGFNSNSKAEGNHVRRWTDDQRIKYSKSRKGKKASQTLLDALQKSRKVGSESNLSSIDELKVVAIINSINEGLTPKEVAKLHSVGINCVRTIYLRKTWTHITKDLYIRPVGKKSKRAQSALLNEDQVRKIKNRLLNGESHLDLA